MTSMAGNSRIANQSATWYSSLYNAIKQTPFNATVLIVSTIVFYKVLKISRRRHQRHGKQETKKPDTNLWNKDSGQQKLQPLRKDFTVSELREYNGTRKDGRLLVAINFNVYDVSRSVHYYGQHGVYPNYAGRDISRNLINFSVDSNESEEFDDLCDLSISQMKTLREWDLQYREKYPYVGKLLRPGELHTNYTEEEEFEKPE
ncbi:membrane-associated progesterone receptor component 1 [Drosophila ficusphila]|uniref:membrane-associated progesterone receptor component 1 n=1 Tax=Drosophila ficusphila TaxID=30025 RepID=UPI0007E85EC6|nr:membrane-associated progesterone receptor component 1 [Drosophila ficusphila]XP_017047757.1 membrane-associated progesterone receptor component 1 [Drosophila ficusphila]